MYGGRPLGMLSFLLEIRDLLELINSFFTDVRFNDRWHTFTPTAAKGGQMNAMQADIA